MEIHIATTNKKVKFIMVVMYANIRVWFDKKTTAMLNINKYKKNVDQELFPIKYNN